MLSRNSLVRFCAITLAAAATVIMSVDIANAFHRRRAQGGGGCGENSCSNNCGSSCGNGCDNSGSCNSGAATESQAYSYDQNGSQYNNVRNSEERNSARMQSGQNYNDVPAAPTQSNSLERNRGSKRSNSSNQSDRNNNNNQTIEQPRSTNSAQGNGPNS